MTNSIEEYLNLIELLKKALEFYANANNYHGAMGTAAMIDLDEHGSQARFALLKIKEFDSNNQKLMEDYEKIVASELKEESNGTDPQLLINVFKNIVDDREV